ncbi:MAG: hypothetical protein AAF108_10895 [Planctomycetota bacterium]
MIHACVRLRSARLGLAGASLLCWAGSSLGQLPGIVLKVEPPPHTEAMGRLAEEALATTALVIDRSPIARVRKPAAKSADDSGDPAASDTDPGEAADFTAAVTTVPPPEAGGAIRVLIAVTRSGGRLPTTEPFELPLTEDLTDPEALGQRLAALILNTAVPPTVISVRSGVVLIDAGTPHGLTPGERLDVTTPPRKALNLETGDFETRSGRRLATIELVRVRGKFSEARVVEGVAEDLVVGALCTPVTRPTSRPISRPVADP